MCGRAGCGQSDSTALLPEAQQVLRGCGAAASQKFPGRVGEHVDSRAGVERHLRIQRGGAVVAGEGEGGTAPLIESRKGGGRGEAT